MNLELPNSGWVSGCLCVRVGGGEWGGGYEGGNEGRGGAEESKESAGSF